MEIPRRSLSLHVDDGETRFSIQFTGAFLLRKSQRDLEVELTGWSNAYGVKQGSDPIRRTG